MPLPLFVSCQTGTEEDAAAELTALLQPTVPVKTLQGQVLVTIDVAKLGGYDRLATLLGRLVQVDYVHALLASTALYGTDVNHGPLDSIQTAAAGVSPDTLAAAVELWRAACRASSDAAAVEAAALPMTKLVFRCLGKRGGRRHDFSSDDAKRAAGRGLKAAAVGLSGSTRDYHFDVLTQVHCNRCWLGLRVNKQPLRVAAVAAAAVAEASGGLPRQGKYDPSQAYTSPHVEPSGTGRERRTAGSAVVAAVAFRDDEDTAASATATATATATARRDGRAGAVARPPALLASWGRAHLRALGLERPRDARDAAAPLHEMSLAEQRARKQAEMQEVVQRIVRGSGGGGGGGGGGGDGLSRRGRKRLELAQLGEACGALSAGGEPSGAAVDERGGEEGGGEHGEEQRPEKAGGEGEGEGEEGGGNASALAIGPIRFAEASRDQRNKCEFHVGRDRQGRPCLGFRLGEGQAADGEAVAPPDGISFVPPWMVAAAAAATAFLREAGGARLVWRSLMLRVQLVRGAAGGGRREAGGGRREAGGGRREARASLRRLRACAVLACWSRRASPGRLAACYKAACPFHPPPCPQRLCSSCTQARERSDARGSGRHRRRRRGGRRGGRSRSQLCGGAAARGGGGHSGPFGGGGRGCGKEIAGGGGSARRVPDRTSRDAWRGRAHAARVALRGEGCSRRKPD